MNKPNLIFITQNFANPSRQEPPIKKATTYSPNTKSLLPPSTEVLPTRHTPHRNYPISTTLMTGVGVLIIVTIAKDIVTFSAGVSAADMLSTEHLLFDNIKGGKRIQIEGHGVPKKTI